MLSASAGLGGSLLLIPGMSLLIGTKEGIAVSAVMLACNNVFKVIAYRRTIPLVQSLAVLLMTLLGTLAGAWLLVVAPTGVVSGAVIASILVALALEVKNFPQVKRFCAPLLALAAGATSGFSGTSGPLKGVALRSLGFDRLHFVGAASLVSLAGDAMKVSVYAHASLLPPTSLQILVYAVPLMPFATLAGQRLNSRLGERWFAVFFWVVMGGYIARLVFSG